MIRTPNYLMLGDQIAYYVMMCTHITLGVGLKKNLDGKIFVSEKSCGSEKIFGLKKILGPRKILGKKRILCPKNICVRISLGQKKMFSPPKKLSLKKRLWSEKNFRHKEEFWPQKDLGFLSLGSPIVEFGGVLVFNLVVLVTWVLRT